MTINRTPAHGQHRSPSARRRPGTGLTAASALITVLIAGGCVPTGPTEPTVVPVAALLPLTGAAGSLGTAAQPVMLQAVDDANAGLAALGSVVRIRLDVVDTASSPDQAADALRARAEAGAGIVIGPLVDSASERCLSLADRVDVLLVSPTSDVATLATPDDNLVRLVPNERQAADALVASMTAAGIAALAIIHSDDADGAGLAGNARQRFADAGGVILGSIAFNRLTTGNDFMPPLTELANLIAPRLAEFDGRLAVLAVTLDEGRVLLAQASRDSTLRAVRWWTGRHLAQSTALLDDAQVAPFVTTVGLTAVVPAAVADPAVAPVQEELAVTLGGPPANLLLYCYDAVWIAALTVHTAGGNAPGQDLRAVLPAAADVYRGLTGTVVLDAAGDRSGIVETIWRVSATSSGLSWVQTGEFPEQAGADVDGGSASPEG